MVKKISLLFVLFVLCVIGIDCVNSRATSNSIQIDATNFPDACVRKSVEKYADTNKNGVLSQKEIIDCGGLTIKGTKSQPIQSLTGLDKLTKLHLLSLYYPSETCLNDTRKCKSLDMVYIEASSATYLNLSSICVKKIIIDDDLKTISSIFFSNKVESIIVESDTIEKIDFADSNIVKDISISCPILKNISFEKISDLQELSVGAYGDINMDFRNNPKL